MAWGAKDWRTSFYFASIPDETGATVFPPQAIERLRCHLLLDLLSDDGLQEARESLLAMLEFYHSLAQQPALPAPPVIVDAERGETYDRPSFFSLED